MASMAQPQYYPAYVRSLLAIFCLCYSVSCEPVEIGKEFSVGPVNCNLTSIGLPFEKEVTVRCSTSLHVNLQEDTLESILQECNKWLKLQSFPPRLFELHLKDLHVPFTKPQDSTPIKILNKLRLQECKISELRREFLAKWLAESGSVSFSRCTFQNVACSDLGRAFSTGPINELEFTDCTWCKATTIGNITASQMSLTQPVAQQGSLLHIDEVTLSKNLSIVVQSGLQQVRLGRVRPAHLVLTGLVLSDPLGKDFLRDAKPYSVQLRRCKLPPGSSDGLLQNVQRMNDLRLWETDIEDLPVGSAELELSSLDIRHCRLDRVNFSRLNYASRTLTSLSLVNASIKQLPTSWSSVANGSILGRLMLVDLSNNGIRSVPFVPNGRPYSDAAHFVVRLGGNPLHCGCELKWLASNDDSVQPVYRNDDPKCVTPRHLAGLRVADAFRRFDPCNPAEKIGAGSDIGGGGGSGTQSPDSPPAEAGASVLAIVVAIVVALIVAILLLVLCCQLKKRAGSRTDRDKVKYTLSPWEDNPVMQMNGYSVLSPASKEDPRSNSDRTTMLRNDESHAGKSANV